MKSKEYKLPGGATAVFEYDENGVGKITLECMDILMRLINDRKTDNCSEKPNNCDTCKHNKLEWYSEICDSCCGNNSHYEPQTNADQHVQHVESVESVEQTEREGEL